MKELFVIDNDFHDVRLDRWFRKRVNDVPQSLIEKHIRKGNIKVNKKKQKSSYKLQKLDKVYIYNLNFIKKNFKSVNKNYIPTNKEKSFSSNFFIENNENFSVINKPAGVAVQSGTKSKRNIIDILRYSKEFKDSSPFTVHRIDKETTGVLIVAKNRKYAQLFTSLFRIRKIHKTYICIVLGLLEKNKGTFVDILSHYEGDREIKSKAITHYKVIDNNKNYSLLSLNPETGRKHQLRKQLLLRGFPILGDSKYRFHNIKPKLKNMLMLHAHKIHFMIDGKKYNFVADLPVVFKKALNEKYLKIR